MSCNFHDVCARNARHTIRCMVIARRMFRTYNCTAVAICIYGLGEAIFNVCTVASWSECLNSLRFWGGDGVVDRKCCRVDVQEQHYGHCKRSWSWMRICCGRAREAHMHHLYETPIRTPSYWVLWPTLLQIMSREMAPPKTNLPTVQNAEPQAYSQQRSCTGNKGARSPL